VKIPYGIGAYRRSSARLPEIICRNQYVESAPSNAGEMVALIPRPGLSLFQTLGTGPVRGMYRQDGVLLGDIFTVSGQALYRGSSSLGTITGGGIVDIDALSDEVFIAAGTFYSTDGVTVSTISFPDNANVVSVACIDGTVVAVREDTGRMYFRTPGSVTWDALDYFSAEEEPDPVIAVRKVGNELWAFGTSTVQPFASTGSSDTPFQPIQGREFLRGCRSRSSIAELDNSIFWVGEDGIVYRGSTTPIVVSTPSVSERIKACDPTDLSAFTYSWDGHVFYVLKTLQSSWVFDISTGEWHEATSYGLDYWRAGLGVMDSLSVYVGDTEDGRIWTLNADLVADGSDVLERTFTAGIETDQPGPCDVIQIDATSGFVPLSTTAVVELRWSDDVGNTWSNWRSASLGVAGNYRKQVAWRALGLIDVPGRVFEFRLTDPAPWRLSAVRMNETFVGGRSRG